MLDDLVSQKEQERITKFIEHYAVSSGDVEEINADVIQAISESHFVKQTDPGVNVSLAFVGSLTMCSSAIPDNYIQEDQCGGLPVISNLSSSEI